MNILYLLIGCSILLALVFLAAFFWAVNSGQNDDMQTPAMRILFEEDVPEKGKVESGEWRIENGEKGKGERGKMKDEN